jgi:para-nitrobenzyl esterase
MVWFHGGGWVNGAGTDVQPSWPAAEDNVVVTVNYRLGALGYLALPALDAESGDKRSSGQYGDLDKVEALR